MDKVSKEKRSEVMSRIHQPTELENLVHNWLVSQSVPHVMYPKIEGSPDILLHNGNSPVYIFLDGCFWHCCPMHYRRPKSRQEFWVPHIEGSNQRREERRTGLPYRWVRVWEHDVKNGDFQGIILGVLGAKGRRYFSVSKT